jgi:putative Holliday junction resolvase
MPSFSKGCHPFSPKEYKMARILAVDYGKKRTGLAVTDPLQLIPGGLTTVASHDALAFILDYCTKEPVERILVGYPTQLNSQPSESMQYVEPFYKALKKRVNIPVEYIDERFTSVLAHKAMLEGGLRKKARQNKALVDELSAVILLQTYLESR